MVIAQKGFLVWVCSLVCAVKWHRQCCNLCTLFNHLSSFLKIAMLSAGFLTLIRPGLNPRMDWLSILPQKVSIYEEKCMFVAAAIGKCKRKTSRAFTAECLWLRSTFEFKVTFNPYEAFILAERPADGGLPGLYRCNQQTTIMTS